MAVLPTIRETSWHEAYHAASLIVSGLVPALVRVDRPGDDAGRVEMDWQRYAFDKDTAIEMLVSVLMGALTEQPLYPWTWPIQPDEWQVGTRRDAEVARLLAEYAQVDGVTWTWILHRVRRRANERRFRRLVVAISQALEEREILFSHELQTISESIT